MDIASTLITSDTTFVANITYRFDVNFVVDENIVETIIVSNGECSNTTIMPSKEHYNFVGWSVDGINIVSLDAYPITKETNKDYSTQLGKMQKTFQSSYFNERFGRNDFKEIDEQERRLGNALAYLMKYIEKTGEKIVYSKGLPQYFISDILDEDIICTIGQEDKKLLLFDDFTCIDEGEVIGKVNSNTIEQMQKSN